GAVQGVEQAAAAVHLTQEEAAGIGGEGTAGEVGDDLLAIQAGKGDRSAVTVCHSDGLTDGGEGCVQTRYPSTSKAGSPAAASRRDEISRLAGDAGGRAGEGRGNPGRGRPECRPPFVSFPRGLK